MASELSRFIEDELKQRGFYEEEKKGLIKDSPSRTSNALRFESRVKDQQESAKAKSLTRNLCIIGGILLVVVVWIVLISSSGGEGMTNQFVAEGESPKPDDQKGEVEVQEMPVVPVMETVGNETVENIGNETKLLDGNETDIEPNKTAPSQEIVTPTPTPAPKDNSTDVNTPTPTPTPTPAPKDNSTDVNTTEINNTTSNANDTLITTPLPEPETANITNNSTTPESP